MSIPVQNIYYLLCYAWDEFAPKQLERVASEAFPDTAHLFASLISKGVQQLHRRGFEAGYVTNEDAATSPRGHILMTETSRLAATQPTRVWCAHDDMSVDVLTNQILKATLWRLLQTEDLINDLKAEVRQAWNLFAQVQSIDLSARDFYLVNFSNRNRLSKFLINICSFLFESMQPLDRAGRYVFQDVFREPVRLRRIYEKFVRNFYRKSQSVFAVKRDKMTWVGSPVADSNFDLVPKMETDVTLRSASRTIVIECKYTDSIYQENYFNGKLRSPHLYQLATYLRNLGEQSEGILLYPTAGVSMDQSYILQEHSVRIKTLDLNRSWSEIAASLGALLADPAT
jgi:5-methylcytosine-specific restriction enzyme subunit McrC